MATFKDYKNAKTKVQGVHFSRYIASWVNCGGTHFGTQFDNWLRSEGVTEVEIDYIRLMATCGKLELEMNCKKYIKKMKEAEKKLEEDENWEPENDEDWP